MKRTLTEELKRIHSITYGQKLTEQEGFIDKILKTVGVKDDPKKADLVSSDVQDFYKTIEDSITSGGLSQQKKGDMSFQKGVESMQIGLILLGYELPKHGVDGLFGPETANAVRRFKSDKLSQVNEDASTLRDTLDDLGYVEKGSEITSGGNITNEISQIVSQILKDYKQTNPNVKVVVTAGNDAYHKKLNYKSKHTEGRAIDVVLNPYNSENASSFISILNKYKSSDPKFSFIDEYSNPSKSSTGGHFHLQYGEGVVSNNTPTESASPEMLTKLLELLKERGVTSEDLKKHIDKYSLDGLADQNFYAKLLENLGAPISEENLKFMYAWRQAEGSGGKYNPFNTTWELPGSQSINSHGVKDYASLQDGMIATIKTLKNGRYNCILDGLKNDIGASNIAKCESLKTWGTGDLVAKVVASYNSGSSPKIKSLS